MMQPKFRSVVALSGGVGGARFAYGLSRALDPGVLTVIVNTGDDFVHWGLSVCPDIDTVLYTLSELSDDERGWGLAGETFETLGRVRRFGGTDWFMLGDKDLATHIARTEALARGKTLTEVTAHFAEVLGTRARVVPMADGPCRTMIETETDGTLPFQEWFVGRRAAPRVRQVTFQGDPPAAPAALAAIAAADAVIVGPSNPYVSIDPILSRAGMRDRLRGKRVVAVSPIVGGRAVKGPLAEMIDSLAGRPPSAKAVADHYGDLLSGFVVENGDEGAISPLPVLATNSVMRSRDERVTLAREVLAFAAGLR
jgi:LPPG:FO 2-phospho-L-lactate transferase